MLNFFKNISLQCDAPKPWGLYFQDSASPQMEGLEELHDNIMFYLIIILFGVGWILFSVVRNYSSVKSPISHKYLNHGKTQKIKEYNKHNNMVYIRYFSTKNNQLNNINSSSIALNPFFVTGFTDGEGSFSISFSKKTTLRVEHFGKLVQIFLLV